MLFSFLCSFWVGNIRAHPFLFGFIPTSFSRFPISSCQLISLNHLMIYYESIYLSLFLPPLINNCNESLIELLLKPSPHTATSWCFNWNAGAEISKPIRWISAGYTTDEWKLCIYTGWMKIYPRWYIERTSSDGCQNSKMAEHISFFRALIELVTSFKR